MGELSFLLNNTTPDPTRTVSSAPIEKAFAKYEEQLRLRKAEEKQTRIKLPVEWSTLSINLVA